MSLKFKGYTGTVEFCADEKKLHGKVLGVRDFIIYQGESVSELEKNFQVAIDDYLEDCAEEGQQPEKPFSGKFALRLKPDSHRRASEAAEIAGVSLNQWFVDLIDRELS